MSLIKFPGSEIDFFNEIEQHVRNSNISLIDAVIHWCAEKQIELEYAATLILTNPAFKAKLQIEAEDLHFLKRTNRLPI